MILGVGSMASYAVLSLVTNAQPSTSANPGWVAVLQPGASSEAGEILLRAEAAVPGAPGNHPSLVYSVLACGDQPFRGVLLLGGQARLDTIVVIDQNLVPSADRAPTAPHVSTVPDLALGFGDTVWHLGPVQEIRIVIDHPTPCFGPAGADQHFTSGTGTTVSGVAQGPIQRTGSFWGINGPRTSQVWPLIGGFPTAPQGMLGLFTGLDGLQGTWSIPAVLHKQIVSGGLTARATVDVAIPPLADASRVVWDSATPLRATARVTNIDDMDWWQNWLIGGGIFLGVGASLLASLLFEMLRPKRDARSAVAAPPESSAARVPQLEPTGHKPLSTSTRAPATALVVVAALAVVAYVLRRPRH
ncbi:hypothetical protein [Actinophytocola sp.]|uniref:hypothetical protein n=1 Tax=Actinophytocola sp. TaxID=1872138 RepID=UPI00389B0F00